MSPSSNIVKTAKTYASNQEVRWCPGCGDYAILRGVLTALANQQADPAKTVFVSGIGCAARFPYYLETYGLHTIHGRAPAFATGIKLANPELGVWIVTGDGDALSIGGNHLLHILRRNIDLNILLLNNEVYGLTKGQYSPTSAPGLKTPSSPMGSLDRPVHPCRFALGSGARFVARSVDTSIKSFVEIAERASAFSGTAFVEILQNCIVYNDGVFDHVTDKQNKLNMSVELRHGEIPLFGKEKEKSLAVNTDTLSLEVIDSTDPRALVHDEKNLTLARLLADMSPAQGLPTALGIIYCDPGESYETAFHNQLRIAQSDSNGPTTLHDLMRQGRVWTVD